MRLYLAHEQLSDSGPAIIPYKVMTRLFTTIYGIITGLMSAKLLRARYCSIPDRAISYLLGFHEISETVTVAIQVLFTDLNMIFRCYKRA